MMMLRFHYHWLHLESGKTGVSTQQFMDTKSFLTNLNHWNMDPRWKYWATPDQLTGQPVE